MYHFINNDFAREYFVLRFHSNYLANEENLFILPKKDLLYDFTCSKHLGISSLESLAGYCKC